MSHHPLSVDAAPRVFDLDGIAFQESVRQALDKGDLSSASAWIIAAHGTISESIELLELKFQLEHARKNWFTAVQIIDVIAARPRGSGKDPNFMVANLIVTLSRSCDKFSQKKLFCTRRTLLEQAIKYAQDTGDVSREGQLRLTKCVAFEDDLMTETSLLMDLFRVRKSGQHSKTQNAKVLRDAGLRVDRILPPLLCSPNLRFEDTSNKISKPMRSAYIVSDSAMRTWILLYLAEVATLRSWSDGMHFLSSLWDIYGSGAADELPHIDLDGAAPWDSSRVCTEISSLKTLHQGQARKRYVLEMIALLYFVKLGEDYVSSVVRGDQCDQELALLMLLPVMVSDQHSRDHDNARQRSREKRRRMEEPEQKVQDDVDSATKQASIVSHSPTACTQRARTALLVLSRAWSILFPLSDLVHLPNILSEWSIDPIWIDIVQGDLLLLHGQHPDIVAKPVCWAQPIDWHSAVTIAGDIVSDTSQHALQVTQSVDVLKGVRMRSTLLKVSCMMRDEGSSSRSEAKSALLKILVAYPTEEVLGLPAPPLRYRGQTMLGSLVQ